MSPIYGADVSGSITDPDVKVRNGKCKTSSMCFKFLCKRYETNVFILLHLGIISAAIHVCVLLVY